jgi:hypothetical protein
MMDLPSALALQFDQELVRFEEEKHMPYVTHIERFALERGQS